MTHTLEKAWEHLRDTDPRYLGGSTGAILHTLPSGKKVVVKRGAHPKHITNEYDMNRFLNELGVGVPQATLQQDNTGSPVFISDFEEGARRPSLAEPNDKSKLRQDFAPQALIANWDVFGQDLDNVLMRPDGTPTYVDVGGAGPYRAQGEEKEDQWSPDVGASIQSMQTRMPYANEIYGDMTNEEVGQSYDRYGGQDAMEQAMSVIRDAQTKNILQQRAENLTRQVG